MKAIIDRIKDGVVSIELDNGKMCELPQDYFEGFSEGDAIEITISKDVSETNSRKNNIKKKLSSLFDN